MATYTCYCEDEMVKNNCSGECDLCIWAQRMTEELNMHRQLMNHRGDIASYNVAQGISFIKHIALLQHAGDFLDGNKDSWFTQVVATLVSTCGEYVIDAHFSPKADREHGRSKEDAARMAKEIFIAGTIDKAYWICTD